MSTKNPPMKAKKRYVLSRMFSPNCERAHQSYQCVKEEEFYTPGSMDLLESRRRIAEYSLPRLDFSCRWSR